VQVLNQFGVFKLEFGKFGSGDGEFNEPTAVAELPNGDLAVADRRNRRVQVRKKKRKEIKKKR
jgi:tripartite motif-containing protein 2/3